MADLTRNGERGQLILIAGFGLAVTLVSLALVMNAAIYTENIATRSESVAASESHTYQRSTANAARKAFHYAHNVNNGTYAELDENVTDAMRDYYNVTARQEAREGRIVNVSTDTVEGTNISGGDGGNFENVNNNGDWDLAGGASRTRQFTIFVSDPDDLAAPGGDEFQVVANGGSEDWVLNATHDSGDVTVGINDSGDYDSCTFPSGADFWINITEKTIAGGSCGGLDWGDRPDTYNLRYENASNVQGRYSLIVDTDVSSGSYGSSPRARDHLYSMTVDVVYETNELSYESDVRIAPGERDD